MTPFPLERVIPWICFHTIELWLDRLRHGGMAWSFMLGNAGAEAYWDDPWCAHCRRVVAMERRTGLLFDPEVVDALKDGTAA